MDVNEFLVIHGVEYLFIVDELDVLHALLTFPVYSTMHYLQNQFVRMCLIKMIHTSIFVAECCFFITLCHFHRCHWRSPQGTEGNFLLPMWLPRLDFFAFSKIVPKPLLAMIRIFVATQKIFDMLLASMIPLQLMSSAVVPTSLSWSYFEYLYISRHLSASLFVATLWWWWSRKHFSRKNFVTFGCLTYRRPNLWTPGYLTWYIWSVLKIMVSGLFNAQLVYFARSN